MQIVYPFILFVLYWFIAIEFTYTHRSFNEKSKASAKTPPKIEITEALYQVRTFLSFLCARISFYSYNRLINCRKYASLIIWNTFLIFLASFKIIKLKNTNWYHLRNFHRKN
jgi:hypothetical protein